MGCTMRPIDFLSDNLITFPQYVNQNIDKMATDKSGNINYKMNEHGFRSTSITESSNFNILTLGCSWTIGLGVEQEKIWPTLIQDKFEDSTLWNYSMYGTSTEYIAKQYYKVLSNGYKPDLVLLLWPGFSRRDYLRDDGEYRRIGGWRRSYDPNDTIFRDDKEDLAFLTLQNDYQDLHIFWNSYKFVEQMNKNFNIPTFHSVAGYYYEIFQTHMNKIVNFIDMETFFLPKDCYQNDMTAQDGKHPGKDWHNLFSNKFYDFLSRRLDV